jgi:hypothetical protein
MATADVIADSGIQTGGPTIPHREHPEAVMLDLEQPIRAIGGRRNALDDLELESTRMEHAIYFEKPDFRSRLSRRLGALRFAHLFLLSGGPVNFPATFALSPLSVALRV